jgi:tRNA nucleotidyltransferase (CCA-adding enzyme)
MNDELINDLVGSEPIALELPSRNCQADIAAIDPETLEICRVIGQAADGLGMKVYAVGGFVRDLILGQNNLDLDFVVEGSAIDLGKKLNEDLPAKFEVVINHERFYTAKLAFHGRCRREIDLSTARTEFYEYPASLPTVEPSKLEQDMFRRDFTINTLAICLNSGEFGELIDLFGGLKDLREKKIRILHPLSFVEDPTRLARAARFAARFGFKLADSTLEQARKAVSMSIFDDLGGARMKNELKNILQSPHRLEALNILASLNPKLCYLDAHLDYTARLRTRLRLAQRLLHRYKVEEDWIVYLGVLLSALPTQRLAPVLDRLHLANSQKDIISGGLAISASSPELFESSDRSRLSNREASQPKRSEIYAVLAGKALDSIIIAASIAPPGAPMRRLVKTYLGELEGTKIELTGADLLALGVEQGPKVGEILRLIFAAKLDGQVLTKDDEIDLARRLRLAQS